MHAVYQPRPHACVISGETCVRHNVYPIHVFGHFWPVTDSDDVTFATERVSRVVNMARFAMARVSLRVNIVTFATARVSPGVNNITFRMT